MAKLTDKFFNRIIEGPLELGEEEVQKVAEISAEVVEEMIESGELDNAKPIYCHPITLLDNDQKVRITCLIFNNSSTAFTIDTFLDWIDALYTQVGAQIRIMASGAYTASSNFLIASYLGKVNATTYYLLGVRASDGTSSQLNLTKDEFKDYIKNLYDGVNKIN